MKRNAADAANKKRADSRQGKLVGRDELAEILGYSVKSLSQMKLPVVSQSKGRKTIYDTAAVIEELLRRRSPNREEESDLKERYDRAAVAEKEAKILIMRGTLVPFPIMEQVLSKIVRTARDSFLALGQQNHLKWVEMSADDLLRSYHEACHRILGHMSDSFGATQFTTTQYLEILGTAKEHSSE